MITYEGWKELIKEKDDIEESELIIIFIGFCIATPFCIIIDILLLPIELLYYIFKNI